MTDSMQNDAPNQQSTNAQTSVSADQAGWTVFDHFQAAVRAQEPQQDTISPLFNPEWMWKQYVAEHYAKTEPPRQINLEAIRDTGLQPSKAGLPSGLASIRREGHIAVALPTDGITQGQWEMDYDDNMDTSWEVEAEEDAEAEREIIDLTGDDDDQEVAAVAPTAEQIVDEMEIEEEQIRAAETSAAVPAAEQSDIRAPHQAEGMTFRQKIKADMKKRTQSM